MKQKFIDLISTYMSPWRADDIRCTGIQAKLTNKELMDFASGVLLPDTVVDKEGETQKIYLTYEDILEAMEELKYEMGVAYNPYEGLSPVWIVELKSSVKLTN